MSCSPSFFPIRFTKGDVYPLYITATVDGSVVNLTGATIRMIAKTTAQVPDADAILNISTTSGDILILNAALGQICVTIPSAATLNVPLSSFPCSYEIVMEIGPPYTSSLGFSGFSGLSGLGLYRNTIVTGTITLTPNVLDA